MDRFDWLELRPQGDGGKDATPRTAPHDGPSFYRAARRMRAAGHLRAAADFYERAVGFDETLYAARVEWIDCLVGQSRLKEANEISAAALEQYKQVRVFYASRALALGHVGGWTKAEPLLDVALEDERAWYAKCVRGELLLLMGSDNRVEALSLFDDAMQETDKPWDTAMHGGRVLLAVGWPQLAAGYFSEACHALPVSPAAWMSLGDCFHALKLFERALFYYQKALELEPKNEAALMRQQMCAPRLFGLTRVFRKEDLRKRWNQAFEKLKQEWEPDKDDF
jgi:tetratricopeptide (TPR) repeat protein